MNLFDFEDHSRAEGSLQYAVEIPDGISKKAELFRVLCELLRFPKYFGFNWDALSDCLRDFEWIQRHRVVLVHKDLPSLPLYQLITYLWILDDAIKYWNDEGGHSLEVVFPLIARSKIDGLGMSWSPSHPSPDGPLPLEPD